MLFYLRIPLGVAAHRRYLPRDPKLGTYAKDTYRLRNLCPIINILKLGRRGAEKPSLKKLINLRILRWPVRKRAQQHVASSGQPCRRSASSNWMGNGRELMLKELTV